MFNDYISAVILILFAEMGDKTQFLAMAFATKYPVRKIILGVAIGAFFNHGLAILLGRAILELIPTNVVGLIAGLMFLFFAMNSLKIEDEEVEEGKEKYGPVLTVSLAFFLGELGDKTQLSALGLSVDSTYLWMVLMGTVTGMILTSLLGIFIGIKLGKNIPEEKLKIAAYIMFVLFGFQKIYQSLALNMVYTLIFALALILVSGVMLRRFHKESILHGESAFARQAEVLKQVKTRIELKVENMCKGPDQCGTCDGKECLVGYMKYLLKNSDKPISEEESKSIARLKNKVFDKAEARMILDFLMEYFEMYPKEFEENYVLVQLRQTVEFILYDHVIEEKTLDAYKKYLSQR
ncbi:TMEM165/GDT1 family protein [Acidaminobacter sp. JC074]|uniref:TMEM165/GDT1 family protein n=1 Tax=Acidaminobacter sp. JC074 TaxID=2530199 RepID=UPI001F0F1AAE|nr:TMEM165/GDT1 family protein [Acidaminobacter sp. JC074]MCH4887570.1 TMEM165/GDT1 family protein [Acidaminobacter sp. JC074]